MSKRETCEWATRQRPMPLYPDHSISTCEYPLPGPIQRLAYSLAGLNFTVADDDCERCPCWKEKETTDEKV